MIAEQEREKFICENRGLVHSCARRFAGRGVDYDDLYQSGCVGLVKACDNFDKSRGLCFSTYAVPVILGEIKKIFRDGGTVKVSRSLKELSIKVAAVGKKLSDEQGCEPTVGAIADVLGVEQALVAEAIACSRAPLSLCGDAEEDGRNIDVPVEGYEEQLTEMLSLSWAVGQLTERERTVVFLRFKKGFTQARTADLLDTTQVQVSRFERRILEKLRNRLCE